MYRIFRVVSFTVDECGARNLLFFLDDDDDGSETEIMSITDVEIILILAKAELVSLPAQRSPARVDEGFLPSSSYLSLCPT